jgi:hypothetical protein
MENLRELASMAIRDSTDTYWDHRSFKRRGIDKSAEPKLDRRQLREQRRKNIKSGDSGLTDIERRLQMVRESKMNGDTASSQEHVLASLAKSIEQLSEGQERTNQILEGMLRLSAGSSSPRNRKEPVRVDPPDLANLPIKSNDPRKIAKDEQQSVATAIYGRMHNDSPLERAGVLMLQQIRNISSAYAQWWVKCDFKFMSSNEPPAEGERQYARPYTNLAEWRLRMEEIRRERRLNEDDDALPPMQIGINHTPDLTQQACMGRQPALLPSHER